MALKANRVGVRKDQVDIYGRPIAPSFFEALVNDLPAWTDLPVWYRGTEQLLPVNDDEPDTSPILCDIEYPVAYLKNNQYFTYRQSPTQKDGKAKIRGIRGRTLVYNQLYEDRHTGTTATEAGITRTYGNENIITLDGTSTSTAAFYINNSTWKRTFYKDHKYLMGYIVLQTVNDKVKLRFTQTSTDITNGFAIVTPTADVSTNGTLRLEVASGATLSNYSARILIVDLTLMFGAGNEPTIEQFEALFPLPYYKYNTGSLLNFAGTKLKTVGYNQVDRDDVELGGINASGVEISDSNNARSINYIPIMPNTKYVFSTYKDFSVFRVYFYDENKTFISPRVEGVNVSNIKFTTPKNAFYLRWTVYKASITLNDVKTKRLQLEFGEVETPFVPYVENETDLPISTFFPTGMKSAGTVYDELTPTRATTRVGAVDLGSLTWSYNSSAGHIRFTSTGINTLAKKAPDASTKANALCSKYEIGTENNVYNNNKQCLSITSVGNITVYDTTYNSADSFKTAMSGVMLNYELAVEDVQPTMSFDTE